MCNIKIVQLEDKQTNVQQLCNIVFAIGSCLFLSDFSRSDTNGQI